MEGDKPSVEPEILKEKPGDDLKTRVQKARAGAAPRKNRVLEESRSYGMAMRLVAELLSGLIVGMGIGWFLDKTLGIKPWGLIVFIFLGLGAGIFNVLRAAKQIAATEARKREEADKADPE